MLVLQITRHEYRKKYIKLKNIILYCNNNVSALINNTSARNMILQSMNKGKQLFIAFYYWRDSNVFQKCIMPLRFFWFNKTVLLQYDREKVNRESCCYAIEIESTI